MAVSNSTYIIQVEESIDALSFTIRNLGHTIVGAYSVVITPPYDSGLGTLIYLLQDNDVLENGVKIDASTLNISHFPDGIYTIQITVDGGSTVLTENTEGFLAQTSSAVMKDALNYRVGMDSHTKYLILEKMRLLDNLTYAAELGLLDAFNENLAQLKKLI